MAKPFRPNPNFERELRATPEFQAGEAQITRLLAEQIKLAAEPFRNTGHFIRRVRAGRRRVLLRDNFAHLAEYGSVNNPPQANVRRAASAAGLRFEDDSAHQAD